MAKSKSSDTVTLTLSRKKCAAFAKTLLQLGEDMKGCAKIFDDAAKGEEAEEKPPKTTKKAPLRTGKQTSPVKVTPTAETPMGEAEAPAETTPEGEQLSVEKLSTMNRRELASVGRKMGLEVKGLKAPDIRQLILDSYGGSGNDTSDTGDCDVTGDENVSVEERVYDGDTYNIGPRALAAIAEGATLGDLIEGEDEVANYE